MFKAGIVFGDGWNDDIMTHHIDLKVYEIKIKTEADRLIESAALLRKSVCRTKEEAEEQLKRMKEA